MRNEIPIDSTTVAAVRGIVTAARHMSDNYAVAAEHWTRDLSRDELVEVVTLLGVLLTMPTVTAVTTLGRND
ncbi:hypothetical protein [Mycobacterium marinum]|uniref:hypothetical protein n=1 Tax=Mycobacterium marinum TaxID=1781 RepID=UPI002341AD0A|nr:hypothetical protein [Mycobacterium marinum]MDC8981247.1 hypothetical protein [Mycobacterium marinum]MDC8992499.1 hypothetical protein [Mycobacterium marinum]WDZ15799.1 hypothetical protein PQR73_009735 [Mycobacterium marinum]